MTRRPLKGSDIRWGQQPVAPPGTAVVPPPSQPMAVARQVVRTLYTVPGGLVLRSHRGDFYLWEGMSWRDVDRRDIRARAYAFLEDAQYLHPEDGFLPFAPTQHKIADVLDALQAIVLIDSKQDAPCWIDRRETQPAAELIPMRNGLLHVPSRTLSLHSALFFNHHALPFAYEPKAAPPDRWLEFLDELWGDDTASIEALQEAFGYVLGGDTHQQKILLVVGPKRAGKGTIGRVLTGLLGAHHVAAPTLASLATNFGLSPLIGKPLALISDARLSTKADSKIVVERLLSISGEDSLTIDRKYREPWTGRLPTRFIVMTNELPKLADSSGALASRFVVLVLTRSFYGAENPRLTDELVEEAPSIFNWALDGLDRVLERGYFQNPPAGLEAIQQLEDLSSPVSAFLRDKCIVDASLEAPVDDVWKAWRGWCDENNQPVGTKAVLGRDLKARLPTLKKVRPRVAGDTPAQAEQRSYVYRGLELKP